MVPDAWTIYNEKYGVERGLFFMYVSNQVAPLLRIEKTNSVPCGFQEWATVGAKEKELEQSVFEATDRVYICRRFQSCDN